MSEPFLGEIRIVGFNFAPRGWAFCDGGILVISQNTALFALLGTTYGGNGQTTFALPDFRGRHAVGVNRGSPSGGDYDLGQIGGTETVTLTSAQMPAHVHQARGHAGSASDASTPSSDTVWGASTTPLYATAIPAQPMAGATTGAMAADALAASGGSQPHENQPPYLTLNYIIALEGVFPSRN